MKAWPTVALADVAAIERDAVQPEAIEDDTIYVGLENIETGGAFSEVGKVDARALASSKFRFSQRHVLYGKLRPYLAKIACPDFSGICSTDILPILPGSLTGRDGSIPSPGTTSDGSVRLAQYRSQASHFVAAISYRYSTNDFTAPSMPCTFGFFDSIT